MYCREFDEIWITTKNKNSYCIYGKGNPYYSIDYGKREEHMIEIMKQLDNLFSQL